MESGKGTPTTGSMVSESLSVKDGPDKSSRPLTPSLGATTNLGLVEGVEWVRVSWLFATLYNVYSVLSIGILPGVCLFFPVLRVRMRTYACGPEEAEMAIVRIVNEPEEAVNVEHFIVQETGEHIISLEARCQRFSASSLNEYTLLAVPHVPHNFPRFLSGGGSAGAKRKELELEREILTALYGPNEMVLPEVSSLEVLIRHTLHPFFLFQYFAVTIWVVEGYYLYAVLIFIITVASIYLIWSESVFNLERLRDLASKTGSVRVLTGDFDDLTMHSVIPDTGIVVGDRVLLKQDTTVPCDLVLISGRVVVDESMLTGESVPVSKSPIELTGLGGGAADQSATLSAISILLPTPSSQSGAEGDDAVVDIAVQRAGSVLSGGSKIKACIGDCVAVAYRTSFRSTKGQLVSMLLNPREGFVNFFSDALWVILFMLILTTVLYIYIAIELKSMGATDGEVALKYFDAITVAVPPALTACLTIATAVAIERLKLRQIFVSDTNRVNFAGVISAACFDKTGTLTEESMDFKGCEVVNDASVLGGWVESGGGDFCEISEVEAAANSLPLIVLQMMATCQNLSLVGEDKKPVGDPLEVELLRASGWSLAAGPLGSNVAFPPNSSSEGCSILRHFEHTPDRMRAASLVRLPQPASSSAAAAAEVGGFATHYQRLLRASTVYYVKGSPESIISLCHPTSVPLSVRARLSVLAKRGLRVIAMAARVMDDLEGQGVRVQGLTQDELEAGGDDTNKGSGNRNPNPMLFLGLLCLSSRLKAATRSTIQALLAADIHTSMITGDHIHTAVAVAQQAGILLPYSATSNRLYIIDELGEPGDDNAQTVIIDAHSDRILPELKLEELLDLAAQCQTQLFSDTLQHMLRPSTHLQPNANVQIACTGRGLSSVLRRYPPSPIPNPKVSPSVPQKRKPESPYTTLVRYASVFARTKPADKKIIVDELMRTLECDTRQWVVASGSKIGDNMAYKGDIEKAEALEPPAPSPEQALEMSLGPFCVLFCGDGANDMSALRAADVGVSLCDAETSVAAPITSKLQTPGSVIDTLLEGRCSLVTAYVLVIYMINYGIIQLFMSLELYSFGLVPSDYTYLIQDLFFSLVLGIAVALTERADELSWQLPPKRFLVFWLLFKLVSQIVVFVTFQLVALYILTLQSWYVPYTFDTPLVDSYAYEATVVINISLAQLMIASVTSTIGAPFRKAWYTNFWHVLALFIQTIWVSYQIFQTGDDFATTWLSLEPLPFDFCLIVLGLIAGNIAVSTALYFVAECFRPAAKRKIAGELNAMEELAVICAKERADLDAAAAVAAAAAEATEIATKPKPNNTASDGDKAPLLVR